MRYFVGFPDGTEVPFETFAGRTLGYAVEQDPTALDVVLLALSLVDVEHPEVRELLTHVLDDPTRADAQIRSISEAMFWRVGLALGKACRAIYPGVHLVMAPECEVDQLHLLAIHPAPALLQ